jgi:hypothetical protein
VQVYTGRPKISVLDRTRMKRKKRARHYSATPRREARRRMDESMNCSDEKHDLPSDAVEALRRKRTILCSLRVVPVSSAHFLGRRYVMELTTTGLARELRVYRSLEDLMRGVDDLGLHSELRDGLCRQLLEEGCCHLLDIVL